MFNPAKAAQNIKDEFVGYISTSYAFADANLQRQLVQQLSTTVDKGPMLDIKDFFVTDCSMRDLINQGVLSPLFDNIEKGVRDSGKGKVKLPLDRPLYLHQVQSIKAIASGNNVVVSTGTGSGKTNCFLIPVLNELLREQEAGTLSSGVRAMFIYPMNALSNDQMRNIREILQDYPSITFGSYNGATETDEAHAIEVYKSMFANEENTKLQRPLDNEILSRDELKKNPPHILFTNYAMLEHLLLRPKDDVLFTNANFKFVVLDEAHVYSGATGIETAMLMRRLQARISSTKNTQFILTSATLGNDSSVDGDVLKFAENLCGVQFRQDGIIRATREQYVASQHVVDYPEEFFTQLADDKNYVHDVCQKYGVNTVRGASDSEILYDVIYNSSLYNRMRIYGSDYCQLDEFAKILAVSMDTAIAFISLCTRAQKNGKPLIDARYHYFIKSLEGCFIALGDSPQLFLERRTAIGEGDNRKCVFEVANCNDCGAMAVAGIVVDNYLIQSTKYSDQVEFFYIYNNDNDQELDDEDIDDSEQDSKESGLFYLCPTCGCIIPSNEIHNPICRCDTNKYILVAKARQLSRGARCGGCRLGEYRRFYLGNDAATSVLATALYEELPAYSYVGSSSDDHAESTDTADSDQNSSDFFTSELAKMRTLVREKTHKSKVKQFLAFSDSRQEAAKFACYMSKSYAEFLRRRGCCHIISNDALLANRDGIDMPQFVAKLATLFSNKNVFADSVIDNKNTDVNSNQNAWVAVLNELVRSRSRTSLTSIGVLQFEYMGNYAWVDKLSERYKISTTTAKSLLDLLAMEIVKFGAVSTATDSDINDDDREYIFFTPKQRSIILSKQSNSTDNHVTSWLPRNKKNKVDEYYSCYRLRLVADTLNMSDKEAYEFLRGYFSYLIDTNNNYHLKNIGDGRYTLPASAINIKFGSRGTAKWYKCNTCGKVTPYALENGQCPTYKCSGHVIEVSPEELQSGNHFANMYLDSSMNPLYIKEHTAQLSKKESAEYQQQFIKKSINALSCSTTFEMGVDVGDLETVFLRNVPPLPANYAQRAGRAGRSVDSAAFALTFAKLSSHDFAFFADPKQMIKGAIMPPLFKIANEKIVRRHMYAIALSMFFAQHPEIYHGNDASVFLEEHGYQTFIDWLYSKPEELTAMLVRSIPDQENMHSALGILDFSWLEPFCGANGILTQLIEGYQHTVLEFENLIKAYIKSENLSEADSCKTRLGLYKKNKVIEFLSRGNILPKYGFPVDTVELQIPTGKGKYSDLRLSRDLQVAIAEYAPSSEVVANGRLYTSRYIKKTITTNTRSQWHTSFIGWCPNDDCKAIHYIETGVPPEGITCSACGTHMTSRNFRASIEPRAGFVAERIDRDVPMSRQDRNYRSEDYYIGNRHSRLIGKHKYLFGDVEVSIESTSNDSLLVKSENIFYVCKSCGYAIASDEKTQYKDINKQLKDGASQLTMPGSHKEAFHNKECSNRQLNRYTLHHVIHTDISKITFANVFADYETMVSVTYALLHAMCDHLSIERNDVKACLSFNNVGNARQYSVIIYDAVAGGAGHSRRLATDNGQTLHTIIQRAKKSMYQCSCQPSCYKCLRSYSNQKIHDKLDRVKAYEFLSRLDGDVEIIDV